jgi:hypothetical protein
MTLAPAQALRREYIDQTDVRQAGRQGGTTEEDREALAASLRPYLAEDLTEDVEDDYADEEDVDDAEVFGALDRRQLRMPPSR